MLQAIRMIRDAKRAQGWSDNLVVDVHPDRPAYRGIALPQHIISLEADPSFEEIVAAGAVLDKRDDAHTVLDDMFLISGEIPRKTTYETGLRNAMRFDPDEKDWFSDEIIADERLLACNLKGKVVDRVYVIATHNSCRQRTGRIHRLQPCRRSQYLQARPRARRGRHTTSCRCGGLPSIHERGGSDPEYRIRSETT